MTVPAHVSLQMRISLAEASTPGFTCVRYVALHTNTSEAWTKPHTVAISMSHGLACVRERESPEDRPPDDVVEHADPAEAPGQRTG